MTKSESASRGSSAFSAGLLQGRVGAATANDGVITVAAEQQPRPPLILATASAIDISVDALTEAGISEVLRRPLSSTELAAALARRTR